MNQKGHFDYKNTLKKLAIDDPKTLAKINKHKFLRSTILIQTIRCRQFSQQRGNTIANIPPEKYKELLLFLFAKGADPNQQTRSKETPLCVAIYNTDLVAVEVLLDQPSIGY